MKSLFLLPLFLFLGWETSQARTFRYNHQEIINKDLNQIKEILLDIENTCDRGCRYHVSGVREMKLVEKLSPNHFFTWIYIDDVRDSTNFNEVRVIPAGNSLRIINAMPSPAKIARLKGRTGLSHAPVFSTLTSTWTLQELGRGRTRVSYKILATAGGAVANLFAGRINAGLRRSAQDIFENIR